MPAMIPIHRTRVELERADTTWLWVEETRAGLNADITKRCIADTWTDIYPDFPLRFIEAEEADVKLTFEKHTVRIQHPGQKQFDSVWHYEDHENLYDDLAYAVRVVSL